MKDWVTVLKAADAAARWHVHQRRKGAAKEPGGRRREVEVMNKVRFVVGNRNRPDDGAKPKSCVSGNRTPASIVPQHPSRPNILSN
jgi:hypothetical protein